MGKVLILGILALALGGRLLLVIYQRFFLHQSQGRDSLRQYAASGAVPYRLAGYVSGLQRHGEPDPTPDGGQSLPL